MLSDLEILEVFSLILAHASFSNHQALFLTAKIMSLFSPE